MGNTTIIELNHDRANEIEAEPMIFVTQILNQLRYMNLDSQLIRGGKIIVAFHRTDWPSMEWEKFKKRIGQKESPK